MKLCFECHDKEITLPDGSKLANIKKIIETGKSLHGPVAQRDCTVCHQIHGSDHRRLLTNEYPTDLYYPFSESAYALCFSCHDKDLVLLERTTTVTNFRNGDQNLHYTHVNRDKKGRTCSVCHDAHAANRERHIRDSIPFGPKGWPLPIGYEKLPDGGQCLAGCHRAFKYDRVHPETYPDEEGTGEWKGTDLVPGERAEPPGNKK
jgi:predicted CXXCH cytochrome family protein